MNEIMVMRPDGAKMQDILATDDKWERGDDGTYWRTVDRAITPRATCDYLFNVTGAERVAVFDGDGGVIALRFRGDREHS